MAAFAAAVLAAPLGAQSVGERVRQIRNGTVRLSFAAREGVCGWGDNMRIISRTPQLEDWENGCRGPVRVALHLRDGMVFDLKTYVGGNWRAHRGGMDLGAVPAAAAADYLLDLVDRLDGDAGKEAILAASLADGTVVWPRLETIGRDASRPDGIRRQAIFWMGQWPEDGVVASLEDMLHSFSADRMKEHVVMALSQHGGDRASRLLQGVAIDEGAERRLRDRSIFWLGQMREGAGTEALVELYDRLRDDKLRERVIFAYSQKRNDAAALDELLTIARSEPNRELRRRAIFWLGQVRDPRAVQFWRT